MQEGMMQTSTLFHYFNDVNMDQGEMCCLTPRSFVFQSDYTWPQPTLPCCVNHSGVSIPESYSLWNKLREESCSLNPTKSRLHAGWRVKACQINVQSVNSSMLFATNGKYKWIYKWIYLRQMKRRTAIYTLERRRIFICLSMHNYILLKNTLFPIT